MKFLRPLLGGTVALLLASGLPAQGVAASVTPNPAPGGAWVVLRVIDASGLGQSFPSGCVVTAIRGGRPDGPIVRTPTACVPYVLTASAFDSVYYGWDQKNDLGQAVGPGTYWFQVDRVDGFGQAYSNTFCVQLEGTQPAAKPVIRTVAPVQRGHVNLLEIDHPGSPLKPYVFLASASSDAGLSLPPHVICLDLDAVFSLSFPQPHPLIFTGWQGYLDGAGRAQGIAVNLPDDPRLDFQPLHVQALVLDDTGSAITQVSNELSLIVFP